MVHFPEADEILLPQSYEEVEHKEYNSRTIKMPINIVCLETRPGKELP